MNRTAPGEEERKRRKKERERQRLIAEEKEKVASRNASVEALRPPAGGQSHAVPAAVGGVRMSADVIAYMQDPQGKIAAAIAAADALAERKGLAAASPSPRVPGRAIRSPRDPAFANRPSPIMPRRVTSPSPTPMRASPSPGSRGTSAKLVRPP